MRRSEFAILFRPPCHWMTAPVSRSECSLLTTALVALLLIGGCSEPTFEPVFVRSVSWALAERWMRVDTHTHTRFSDGASTVSQLADAARDNGCHGIAITDHSDQTNAAASREYLDAIATARAAHEFPYIIAGLEWNVPPYAGREHVSILVHPDLEGALLEFKTSFEGGDAAAGWRWLDAKRRAEYDIVAFYNHPSRKDSGPEENLSDYLSWTNAADILVGFEGGPGHQRNAPRGDYFEVVSTIDGWDPVVAEVGGVWDRLLDAGVDAWGALATSDFHSTSADFAPCEFSRTHVLVPETSVEGILMGLRAGAFWAQMGPFLERLDFRVRSAGLVVPAVAGESFRLGTDQALEVWLDVQRSPAAASQPLEVSLIGNAASGAPEVIATETLAADVSASRWTIAAPVFNAATQSAYLRVRVRSVDSTGTGQLALSNPIRMFAPPER